MSGDPGELRERLRKIEALYAGAATPGERDAAAAAAERIRARLREAGAREPPIEVKFTLADPWTRQLFVALCRRYGLKPFRYPRMHRQTIVLSVPRSFLDSVLWPEFRALSGELTRYLSDVTDELIREAIHKDTTDAEERVAPEKLPRS
jgi:hypothetical protein